jgi:hypothetical protein
MSANPARPVLDPWPELPLAAWEDTYQTLHMWTQIVGKVRLALFPRLNHWWGVTLYVSPVGLTTASIPYGDRCFEIEFDFRKHELRIEMDDGRVRILALKPRSVADFYAEFRAALSELGIAVKIWPMPCELANPITFDKDTVHSAYDREYVQRFWRILVESDAVFKEFGARFLGKASPSHFFWGSFDLATTRFSGRRAPDRPDADSITREAYSHEVISAGFWPGGGAVRGPAYYAYAAPEPPGFAAQKVNPAEAYYHPEMKEFILMYDDVRKAAAPGAALLEFLQTTYGAGAETGKWDRKQLERPAA